MPVCHRFKNFQPRGLEPRQLRFEQTQCRLHPQWHQIELHRKIPQDMGEKSVFSFPSLMFKNDKNAILLQHRSFSEEHFFEANTHQNGRFMSAFLSKGRKEHNRAFTAKQQQNIPENSPMSASSERSEHRSGAALSPRAEHRAGAGNGPAPHWRGGQNEPEKPARNGLHSYIFHVNIQGSSLSLGCVISCVAGIIREVRGSQWIYVFVYAVIWKERKPEISTKHFAESFGKQPHWNKEGAFKYS